MKALAERMIKRACIAVCVLALAGAAAGQRVVTTTRLVALFSGLETDMMTAVAQQRASAVERLLAPEFQVWTPQPPGQPVPRADWLRTAPSRLGSFRLRQMAVRDLGQHAAVSFLLSAGGKNYFVVDLWQKVDDGWQLTDRYESPVQVALPAPRPTGKE